MRVPTNLAYSVIFSATALLVIFAPMPGLTPATPTVRQVRVEASQFGYSPSELYVNRGDTLVIQLVSMDVVHGFYVDGYDVSVEADPGQAKTMTFVADTAGSFRFRCSVTCGAMHPFMMGRLHVAPDTSLPRAAGLAGLAVLGGILVSRQKSQA